MRKPHPVAKPSKSDVAQALTKEHVAALYKLISRQLTSLESRASELIRLGRRSEAAACSPKLKFWQEFRMRLTTIIPYVPPPRRMEDPHYRTRRTSFLSIHQKCLNREPRKGYREDGKLKSFCKQTQKPCTMRKCPSIS